MKLKLDENLGEVGRAMLTAKGHDVSTVALQRMRGGHDVAPYEACRAERRVLVTLDRDFGEVLRFPPEDTAGIAILDCRGRLSPDRSRRLTANCGSSSPAGCESTKGGTAEPCSSRRERYRRTGYCAKISIRVGRFSKGAAEKGDTRRLRQQVGADHRALARTA